MLEELKKVKKSGDTGYTTIHYWLSRNYGRPKQCEVCKIFGSESKIGRWNIQWALKHNKEHEKNINNYLKLCFKCHYKYDKRTPENCTTLNCKNVYFSTGLCKQHYHRKWYQENTALTNKT